MTTEQQITKFLKESNHIENVWDADSLQQAQKAWHYLIQWDELTKANILRTHAILMKGKLNKQELGAWRRCPVRIGEHQAKPWYAVPSLMEFWIDDANQLPKTEEEIKQDHIAFEDVHPFTDGNRRLGRLIFLYQRIKNNLPILIIKEKEKQRYYEWFKE